TDVYNPYFENLNPNRVVVRKDDNSIMSDTDLDILNNYKYTADTFKYDTLLDVQGYLSTKDYYFPTCGFEDIDQLNDELHLGRLPNKVNEVVLSLPSSYIQKDMLDEDIITKVTFSNKQSELDVVIVGIVKSDDYSRVMYVSEELVSHVMLAYDFDLTISSNIVTQRMQSIVKPIDFIDKANTVYLSTYYENYFINCDIQLLDLIIKDANVIFTDNLEDHEVYFSTDIQEKLFITTQLSIYIDDVENLDKLQKDLKELGYETISPYYVSLDTQDILALINKIGMSVLCVVLVIVIYLLGFIVLKLIFSEKTKDFGILKSIGLDKKTILKTNILEITIYFLISTISSVILIEVLSLFLSFFDNFKFYHHSYLLIINLLLGLFISLRFNNYINKKSVMQTIKEK
ncbi:MAG: FtsX-like permease family protein, partial [bacterium]